MADDDNTAVIDNTASETLGFEDCPDFPPQSRMLYRGTVDRLEYASHRADLCDDQLFHGLLWQIVANCPKDNFEIVMVMQQWELLKEDEEQHPGETIDFAEPIDQEKLEKLRQSLLTKFSRWVNRKATPRSLLTRQRMMASALHALRKSVIEGSAIPLMPMPKKSTVNIDVPKGTEMGLGIFTRAYDIANQGAVVRNRS